MDWKEKYINKITCIDCLEGMKELPDKSIDLIYADPPFNTQGSIGSFSRSYPSNSNDKLSESDYDKFCKVWFKLARRKSKKLLVTPGVSNIGRYSNAYWVIVINKPSSPSFNRFGGYNCWEPLLVYDKPVQRILRDVVLYDSKSFKNDGLSKHPCPDSIEMVRWIIDTWTNPGDIVCDIFSGTGTTAVICKEKNRRFIAFEIEPIYVEMGNDRLRQEILL